MKWKYFQYLIWVTVFLVSTMFSGAEIIPVEIAVAFQFYNATNGVALNDTHSTNFFLYEAVSGGAAVLNESQDITYFNGVGHVVLINTSGINDWSVRHRLTVQVAGGTETTPRINITPVPQALFAANATFAVNASNATYAITANTITGTITEIQISDLQAYITNRTNVVFEIINASNWDNVSIAQSQIRDHTIITNIGAQSGSNFTASFQSSFNITGDNTGIITSISGAILTIGALAVNSVVTAFSNLISFTGGITAIDINTTNLTVIQNLSLTNPPVECPSGTFMTQFNGSVSLCVSAITRGNTTGNVNITESVLIEEELLVEGDSIFRTKVDIGTPGTAGGLDIGEGGSYTTNRTGSTIVQAFKYDGSAASGSRFTELTLDATNTLNADAGDRFYVGSVHKFWAFRVEISTPIGVLTPMQARYYNGSHLANMSLMGILKNNATSIGQNIWNQTAEKEYSTWDHEIKDDWIAADDVTDLVPNGAEDMFWIAFEVPLSGLTNQPVVTEIKVRGTDFDFVSGTSYPIFWGEARIEKHDLIPLTIVKAPGGTTTTDIDIDSAHKQTVFDFNGVGDLVSFLWTLPEAIDTSSKIFVELDYAANAADTFDLNFSASKLRNETLIGATIQPDFLINFSITSTVANTVYTDQPLTPDGISIQNMSSNDLMSFELQRTDASNAMYPLSVTLHYVIFALGEHE